MPERTCSVEGCDRRHYGRGWCNTHYQRWYFHGDPLKTLRIRGDLPERLTDKFTIEQSGCWQWKKPGDDGYGLVRWAGRKQPAHRVMYELAVGPVPEGAELDHTCHSTDASCLGGPCLHRSCVNPEHLEPVTPLVNVERSMRNNCQARKTHCPRGHAYSAANTYVSPQGDRMCRTCRQAADRRRSRARRAGRESAV